MSFYSELIDRLMVVVHHRYRKRVY